MLFAFLELSPLTLLILGALSVLLFGERLPDVARAVGKSLMEFKKSMSGIESEIRNAVNSATTSITTSLPSEGELTGYEDTTSSTSEPSPGETMTDEYGIPTSSYDEYDAQESDPSLIEDGMLSTTSADAVASEAPVDEGETASADTVAADAPPANEADIVAEAATGESETLASSADEVKPPAASDATEPTTTS